MLNLKIVIVLFVFFTSFIAFASKPTFEGLLRNGKNPDVNGPLIIIDIMLEEIQNDYFLRNTRIGQEDKMKEDLNPILRGEKLQPKYLKLIFSLEKKHAIIKTTD